MITLARIDYLDLAFLWNRDAGLYQPRPAAKLDAMLLEHGIQLAADRAGFIARNCALASDPAHVASVVAGHADASLRAGLALHVECLATEASERRVMELPMDLDTAKRIREALAAPRLANGFPLLAEVHIYLA